MQFDVPSLSPGVYFVKIGTNFIEFIKILKVVKSAGLSNKNHHALEV